MAVSTVASVHQLAAALLTECESVLATTVGGVPEVSFLSPGLPSLDRQCDTLAVYATAPTMQGQGAPPSGQQGTSVEFAWRTFVRLSVLTARCVPVAEDVKGRYRVPTPAQLTLAAQKVMEDMWGLWNGILGNLVDIFEEHPCQSVSFVALTPLDPQGGFGGWVLDLSAELTGYEVMLP